MVLQTALAESECDGVIHRSEDGKTVILMLPSWADPRWVMVHIELSAIFPRVSFTPADASAYRILVALFQRAPTSEEWDWFQLRVRHILEYCAGQGRGTLKNGDKFTLEVLEPQR